MERGVTHKPRTSSAERRQRSLRSHAARQWRFCVQLCVEEAGQALRRHRPTFRGLIVL
jgi:hypothetical protein